MRPQVCPCSENHPPVNGNPPQQRAHLLPLLHLWLRCLTGTGHRRVSPSQGDQLNFLVGSSLGTRLTQAAGGSTSELSSFPSPSYFPSFLFPGSTSSPIHLSPHLSLRLSAVKSEHGWNWKVDGTGLGRVLDSILSLGFV